MNEEVIEYVLHTQGTVNASASSWTTLGTWIPSGYRPADGITCLSNTADILLKFNSDGSIEYRARQIDLSGWHLDGVAYWRKQ